MYKESLCYWRWQHQPPRTPFLVLSYNLSSYNLVILLSVVDDKPHAPSPRKVIKKASIYLSCSNEQFGLNRPESEQVTVQVIPSIGRCHVSPTVHLYHYLYGGIYQLFVYIYIL